MLGKAEWIHSKGGLGRWGSLEGEGQLTVLKAEATTELGNPNSVSAALGSWSGQSYLLPSIWSKVRSSEAV